MEIRKYCPYCGHEFVQSEIFYDCYTPHSIYTCPECGWEGNENDVIERDSE